MKKIINFSIMFLVLVSCVFALSFNTPNPNGNVLNGTTHNFSINGDIPMSVGWVLINNGSWVSYGLSCDNIFCSAIVNLASYNDSQVYSHYYFVDGTPSSTYSFSINRVPSVPTGFTILGFNETSLNVTWTGNSESDIAGYRIYRSNTSNVGINSTNNIANVSNETRSYLDSGLSTSATYFYKLVVYDILNQSSVSAEANGTVADSIPPVVPIISPVSGTVLNTTTPQINITYPDTQNVSLRIYSGTTLVKDFSASPGLTFTWSPILAANTTYLFNMNAKDPFNNERNTSYQVTTTQFADVNFEVLDTIHHSYSVSSVISSALPGEYMLLRYTFSMYGGAYTRFKMSDLTSAGGNIDINADSQPYSFCSEDFNSTTQDIIANPTKAKYYVLNDYNATAPALNCTDTDASGLVGYQVYLKVPFPASAKSGSYTSSIIPAMYTTQ